MGGLSLSILMPRRFQKLGRLLMILNKIVTERCYLVENEVNAAISLN